MSIATSIAERTKSFSTSEFINVPQIRHCRSCRSDGRTRVRRRRLQHAPASKFKPKSALETKLKAEGLQVRSIKVESGCYEVYAFDKHGRSVNVAYNAETFKKLANAEAGEH